MPKITDERNNPFDKDAPRTKRFSINVNDYDLYDLVINARRAKMRKSTFIRYRLDLVEVKRGAAAGNENAKKKS